MPTSGHGNVLSLLLLTSPTTTTIGCSALLLLKLCKATSPDLVNISKRTVGERCQKEMSTSSRSASDIMDCWDTFDAW